MSVCGISHILHLSLSQPPYETSIGRNENYNHFSNYKCRMRDPVCISLCLDLTQVKSSGVVSKLWARETRKGYLHAPCKLNTMPFKYLIDNRGV